MTCRLVRVRDIFFNTMKRLEIRRNLQTLQFIGDKIFEQRMFLFNFCWLYHKAVSTAELMLQFITPQQKQQSHRDIFILGVCSTTC
jgi:hypothetical protein